MVSCMSGKKNNQVYIHSFFHEELCNSAHRIDRRSIDLRVFIRAIQPKRQPKRDFPGHPDHDNGPDRTDRDGDYQGQGF